MPSSTDLDRITREALDALLCLAGSLGTPRGPDDLAELRRSVVELVDELPDAEPLAILRDQALGRMLRALWTRDPLELARCLATLARHATAD